MRYIKRMLRLIRKYDTRIFFNISFLKILLTFPNANFSRYCVIKIKKNRAFRIGANSTIGDFTKICVDDELDLGNSKLIIGDFTYIGDHNNIRAAGGDILIGNHCLISQHITMVASNHAIRKDNLIFEQPWDTAKTGITIKDDVWIGANVVILPGVTLNKGCVVAAGAVVSKDVPEYAIVLGVPAKVVKYRT